MSKKLTSSEKIGFFQSVMRKNWPHGLPIVKGAFEGGDLEGKRAAEHILLSVWCLKIWNFPRYCSFFPKEVGDYASFPPRGLGGLRRGSTDTHVTNYVSDPNETFIFPVPCRYLQYIWRYERRGTKTRAPRSPAPSERRRRLQINFEASGKHFTSRYYIKNVKLRYSILKIGGKNTVLGTSPSPNKTFLPPVFSQKQTQLTRLNEKLINSGDTDLERDIVRAASWERAALFPRTGPGRRSSAARWGPRARACAGTRRARASRAPPGEPAAWRAGAGRAGAWERARSRSTWPTSRRGRPSGWPGRPRGRSQASWSGWARSPCTWRKWLWERERVRRRVLHPILGISSYAAATSRRKSNRGNRGETVSNYIKR